MIFCTIGPIANSIIMRNQRHCHDRWTSQLVTTTDQLVGSRHAPTVRCISFMIDNDRNNIATTGKFANDIIITLCIQHALIAVCGFCSTRGRVQKIIHWLKYSLFRGHKETAVWRVNTNGIGSTNKNHPANWRALKTILAEFRKTHPTIIITHVPIWTGAHTWNVLTF